MHRFFLRFLLAGSLLLSGCGAGVEEDEGEVTDLDNAPAEVMTVTADTQVIRVPEAEIAPEAP